jgi:hypothetical protein
MPGTVTVTRGAPVGKLPAGFVGFSYEKTHLTDRYFSGANAPLVALYKLLGPGLLRIGGNAVDRSDWQPDAAPAPNGITTKIGSADVDALADFANATGWKVLYAVNFNGSTPTVAVAEAKYAASKLGDKLYGFEIGNEINYFGGYAGIVAKWNTFAAAVKAAVPGAALTGPAVDHNVSSWAVPFAKDEANTISMLTQHYYRGPGASGTMAQLMNPDPGLLSDLRLCQTAVTTNHIRDGYRFAETNSFVNHGTPGVSDSLGAALWSLDFMFTGALHGSSGINFHGGGPGQDPKHPEGFAYTPIAEAGDKVTGPKAVFYGMLLLTMVGPGDLQDATVRAGALNVTSYAVAPGDGSISVVVINKDPKTGLKASVDVGAAVTSASAAYLLGPSLTATSGLTIAGAPITSEGAFNPQPPFALPTAGNSVSVLVPAASAVLIRAR